MILAKEMMSQGWLKPERTFERFNWRTLASPSRRPARRSKIQAQSLRAFQSRVPGTQLYSQGAD